MSGRVSFAEDSALWIATVGNTLIALGAVPFALYGAFMLIALGELDALEAVKVLALLVPVAAGVALLVGYWKALRWPPRERRGLWWMSLAYNVGVVVASVWPMRAVLLFLTAWGLFMCILSGYRALGHGPHEHLHEEASS